MKHHARLIRIFSHLVPRRWRSEWKQEWDAELEHREAQGRSDVWRRSLGAFWDALAMQPRRLEEEVFQDLRFGIRMFANNKALALTAIFSLALGIGANTALFSMVDAVLLKKLPVRNPDELVLFQWLGSGRGLINGMTSDRNLGGEISGGDTFSYAAFQELRRRNTTLAGVFAFAKPYNVSILADDRAEIGSGQWVSGNFFSGLGVGAALGRAIDERDDSTASDPVAMISYRYWQRRFALSPEVIGKTIRVNNAPFTVVGVSEPRFNGTLQVDDIPDVFIPLSYEPAMMAEGIGLGRPRLPDPNTWWIYVMGRTRRGATLEQVRGNLQGAFDQANAEAKAKYKGPPDSALVGPAAMRLDFFAGSRGLVDNRERFQQPLLILMILVGIVLIVACANVANLLLARAAGRQKEIAVRLAMGAGRLRLVRQVLTESVLLAACGGFCAALLAYFTKDLLLRWGPWSTAAVPIDLKLDLRVLAFAAAVSLLAGIVFGLAPAFACLRGDMNSTMKDSSRTLIGRSSYVGKTLLVLQVALSVLLLIGAGLFVRTMHNFHSIVAEYDPSHLLQFDLDPSLVKYDRNKLNPALQEMIEHIESIPGVRSAGVSCCGNNFMGFTDKESGRQFVAQILWVSEKFFDTLGVRLLAGRGFTAADTQGTRPVVIVNEAFVHANFPYSSPLGKTANGEIIGVVRDAPFGRFRQQPGPAIYWTYRQGGFGRLTFRVRTNIDPASVFPLIRQSLMQVDSHLPISNVRTLAEQVDRGLAQENMFAGLSTLFGILALILTSVGFYGSMAYSVARRTSEIGVRMALGARRSDVLRLVMSEGLLLVMIGVGLGIGAALASTRYVESVLFGLASDDGATIIAVVLLMLGIAALAAFIPARKASHVDPLVALRYE